MRKNHVMNFFLLQLIKFSTRLYCTVRCADISFLNFVLKASLHRLHERVSSIFDPKYYFINNYHFYYKGGGPTVCLNFFVRRPVFEERMRARSTMRTTRLLYKIQFRKYGP